MAEAFSFNNLPQIFSDRAATATKARSNVIVEAEQTVQEIEASTKALLATQKQNSADVEGVFDAVDTIQGNVEKITMNPLSELVGLFNSDFNIKTQNAKLSREQLKLQRIGQRQTNAEKAHELTVKSAAQELSLAETRANIAQQELGNLTTQINLGIQARALQTAERERQLGGMTVQELQAAASDPESLTGLGLDIRQGDIRTEILTKQKAALASQALRLDMQAKRQTLTAKQRENQNNLILDVVELSPVEDLQKMAESAASTGGIFTVPKDLQIQPGVVLPAGTNIGMSTLKSAIATKQDASFARTKETASRVAAQTNAAGVLMTAENGLLKAQGQITGAPGTALDIESFPEQHQASILQARSLIEAANQSTDQGEAVALQIEAAATLKTVQETVQKELLDTADKDQKPAMQEFLTTGRIANAANAAEVVAPALLNINASTSNPLLSSVMEGLQVEALRIKESESTGIDLFGTGFPTGKAKKLDNQAFVAQAIDNYSKSFPTPVAPRTIISGEALVNYSGQIVEQLAKSNPDAWGGLYENGAWTSAVRGKDGVSDQDIVRALRLREKTLRESGTMQENDPSLYSLFRNELRNDTLLKNYISNNLTPNDHQSAAMFATLAGNQQVQGFMQRIMALDSWNAQLSQILEQDNTALQTENQKAAQLNTFIGDVLAPGISSTIGGAP